MNGSEDCGQLSSVGGVDDTVVGKCNGLKQNVNIAKSIKKLRDEKSGLETRLKEVEALLDTASRDKANLLCLCEKLQTWAERIKIANRNNQGVPYVRDVKAVCNEILTEVKREAFQKSYTSMMESDIPCFSLVSDVMKALEKVCSKVLQNEANYNAMWVEEMRQLIGRLTGSANAILDLHFEE
eukprot:gene15046-16599_t